MLLADTGQKLEDESARSTTTQRSTYDKNYQGPGTSTGQFREQITVDILTINDKGQWRKNSKSMRKWA